MKDAVLRALHTIAAGGWLGAAAITGFVVAPHSFAAFPTRVAAGEFVGGVLHFVDAFAIVVGGIVVVVATLEGGGFQRVRIGLGVGLASVGVVSLGLAHHIASLREQLGPIDALPPDSPGRKHFGMMHGISVLIFLHGMLVALAAIALESYDSSRKSVPG